MCIMCRLRVLKENKITCKVTFINEGELLRCDEFAFINRGEILRYSEFAFINEGEILRDSEFAFINEGEICVNSSTTMGAAAAWHASQKAVPNASG